MYYFGSSFINIKLCFDSLFCILVLLPGDDSCQAPGRLPQSFFYIKPCPSPNMCQ